VNWLTMKRPVAFHYLADRLANGVVKFLTSFVAQTGSVQTKNSKIFYGPIFYYNREMEEEHAEEIPKNTEQRFIGGTRVLLVKRYDGQKRPPPPPPASPPTTWSGDESEEQPKRYLLERRVSIPPGGGDQKEVEPKALETRKNRRRRQVAALGIFGGFAAAAVGLWLYAKNSEESGLE